MLVKNVPNVLVLTFDYFVYNRLIMFSRRKSTLDKIQFFSSLHDKAQSLFLIIALWTVS